MAKDKKTKQPKPKSGNMMREMLVWVKQDEVWYCVWWWWKRGNTRKTNRGRLLWQWAIVAVWYYTLGVGEYH